MGVRLLFSIYVAGMFPLSSDASFLSFFGSLASLLSSLFSALEEESELRLLYFHCESRT